MNNMDKKILIYCRVSTQQQTTDRQKEELFKGGETMRVKVRSV